MKRNIVIFAILFSLMAVARGAEKDIEWSLSVLGGREPNAIEKRDKMIPLTLRVRVVNRSGRTIRIPTKVIFERQQESSDAVLLKLDWDLLENEGVVAVYSESLLDIVEIRPGESGNIFKEIALTDKQYSVGKIVVVINVTQPFAKRYSVEAVHDLRLEWQRNIQ